MRIIRIVAASAVIVFAGSALSGCGPQGGPTQTGGGSIGSPVDNSAGDPLDPTRLPLGDYHVTYSAQSGEIFSCQTVFNGGGASGSAPWIHVDGTWDATSKARVAGQVAWPSAVFSITLQGATRVVSGNGLPVGFTTGVFPIAANDPARQYDQNPNAIGAHSISYNLPAIPTAVPTPSCTPGGMIGVALDGVPIFNGLDAGGRDAVAHEVQDDCGGHPQQ